MKFRHLAGAAYRALTARKDGPSLYDLCDPLFLRHAGGDPHLAKFYRTALGNPALRPLLRRAGLPELREPSRFKALRHALTCARDDESPDWAAIGQPVAELLDTIHLQHPKPKPGPAPGFGEAPAAGLLPGFGRSSGGAGLGGGVAADGGGSGTGSGGSGFGSGFGAGGATGMSGLASARGL